MKDYMIRKYRNLLIALCREHQRMCSQCTHYDRVAEVKVLHQSTRDGLKAKSRTLRMTARALRKILSFNEHAMHQFFETTDPEQIANQPSSIHERRTIQDRSGNPEGH